MKVSKVSFSSDLFKSIEIPSGIPKFQRVHWLAVGIVVLCLLAVVLASTFAPQSLF